MVLIAVEAVSVESKPGDCWSAHLYGCARYHCLLEGHQSRHALSRSLLWAPIMDGGGLFIASGNEGTNQPWIWDASTGQLCRRLTAHASPVLDVALVEDNAWGVGLLAAVSQGEMKVYQTSS